MYSTLLALALSTLPALAAPSLKVTVNGPATVTDVDDFIITTTITNVGDETATLANNPNSVLASEWKTNVFDIVSDSGVPAKFKGVKVKWSPEGAIKAGDVTVIRPGETRIITQDLGGVYDLSKSGEGAYTITPLGDFQLVSPEGKLSPTTAAVTPFLAKVSGKLAPSRRARSAGLSRIKRTTFTGCTGEETDQITAAAEAAEQLITESLQYLEETSESSSRYTSWFGEYRPDLAAKARDTYSNMNSNEPTEKADYDCTCTKAGVFAYVYPDQPYQIYLCPAFWSAPPTGTDSQAGTIVHEMSHFKVVGGTQDYAYGQANCRELASSDPEKATLNADNYEYFAENTPEEE